MIQKLLNWLFEDEERERFLEDYKYRYFGDWYK